MWWVMAASVQGASHQRANKPNQDAVGFLPLSGLEETIVAAVADGHGSAKAFRSKTGSALAVNNAIEHLVAQVRTIGPDTSLTTVRRLAEEQWPRNLLHGWRKAVEDDWLSTPVTDVEKQTLDAANTIPSSECDFAVYGTTLLACVLTPRFLVFLQLGDGDILVVSADGVVSRPLPHDERLFANETTSLGSARAWADWRTGFYALDPEKSQLPALIMLSTDGYANSFRDDAGFLQVPLDLLASIRLHGRDSVAQELSRWLTEATVGGSGDDVTVCLIGTC